MKLFVSHLRVIKVLYLKVIHLLGLAHSLKCIATKVEYLKPEHVTIDLSPSPRIISDYAQQIISGIPPTYERNDQDLPTYEDQKASMVSGIKNPFN